MISHIASLAVLAGALVSSTVAEPAMAAAIGAAGIGVGVAATAAAGFSVSGALSLDKQRHAKMEFLVPNVHTEWTCGSSVNVKYNTFGFGSFWRLSNAKFTLLDSSGNKVEEVNRGKTADAVKEERTAAIGRARNGRGEITWNIPTSLSTGSYMIEFESSNLVDMDRSRHRFLSSPFKIQCDGAPSGNANSDTKKTN
ncbi:hypothetical protein BKA69DRAFT_1170850 [Paraphysoderma sedebokerense]|nr:hypothetical protein BKA69DRAFT_1170850 [Paraphysoderma sedebokerense]